MKRWRKFRFEGKRFWSYKNKYLRLLFWLRKIIEKRTQRKRLIWLPSLWRRLKRFIPVVDDFDGFLKEAKLNWQYKVRDGELLTFFQKLVRILNGKGLDANGRPSKGKALECGHLKRQSSDPSTSEKLWRVRFVDVVEKDISLGDKVVFALLKVVMSINYVKRDYYEVLWVSKSAAADEIKKHIRKLAINFTPNKTR